MTETELEELDVLLSSVEGVSASLPVDGLHGFLTALVMSGGKPRVEPILPWILKPMPGLPLDLEAVPQARRVGELVGKMMTRIDIELDDPEYLFAPMARVYPHRDEERSDGSVWCAGFLRGIAHAWDRARVGPLGAFVRCARHTDPAVAGPSTRRRGPGARVRGRSEVSPCRAGQAAEPDTV